MRKLSRIPYSRVWLPKVTSLCHLAFSGVIIFSFTSPTYGMFNGGETSRRPSIIIPSVGDTETPASTPPVGGRAATTQTLTPSSEDIGRGGALSTATAEPPSPVQALPFHHTMTNVIIFDWDDTLLASHCYTLAGPSLIPHPEMIPHLPAYEASIVKLLETAINTKNSKVYIVTNATKDWIPRSAEACIPKVVDLLLKVTLISARDTYQDFYQGAPLNWKVAAFHQIAQSIVETATQVERLQFFSLGDAIYERIALLQIRDLFPGVLTKGIKLVESPTLDQLRKQIELIHSSFEALLNHRGSLDLMLRIEILPE